MRLVPNKVVFPERAPKDADWCHMSPCYVKQHYIYCISKLNLYFVSQTCLHPVGKYILVLPVVSIDTSVNNNAQSDVHKHNSTKSTVLMTDGIYPRRILRTADGVYALLVVLLQGRKYTQ